MTDEDAELEENVRRNLLSGRGPRPEQDPGSFEALIQEFAPRRLGRGEVFSVALDWSTVCDGVREARAWLQAGARISDLETVRRLREARVPPRVAGQWTPAATGGETYFDLVRKGLISAAQLRDLAIRSSWLSRRDGDAGPAKATGT